MSLAINIILIILGAASFFIQVIHFYDGLKRSDGKEVFKKLDWKGWTALVIGFLLATIGIANVFVVESEKKTTAREEFTKYQGLKDKFDSLKNSFGDKINSVAMGMSYEFGKGVSETNTHGDTNTIKILADALSNKKELKQTVDSLNLKLLSMQREEFPNVTYPDAKDSNQLKCIQSNDSFFILLPFSNLGNTPAKNISFNVYYLDFITDSTAYEYYKPISSVKGFNLAAKSTTSFDRSTGTYMTRFVFDPNNKNQFILALGEYYNEDDIKPKKFKLLMCYRWESGMKSWRQFGGPSHIEDVHLDTRNITKIYTNNR